MAEQTDFSQVCLIFAQMSCRESRSKVQVQPENKIVNKRRGITV